LVNRQPDCPWPDSETDVIVDAGDADVAFEFVAKEGYTRDQDIAGPWELKAILHQKLAPIGPNDLARPAQLDRMQRETVVIAGGRFHGVVQRFGQAGNVVGELVWECGKIRRLCDCGGI